MKYFTPKLIAEFGSDDSATWKTAEARWEELCDEYSAYLDTIKTEFPPGIQHIEDSYYLHDATIQGMGLRDGALVIVLRLDPPPQSLLFFTYDLVEEPRIDREAVPQEIRAQADLAEWLYDEIEKVPGQPPTWRQSILLSNGWEVTLHYRDVKVEEIQPLLPAPRYGVVTESLAGLTHSA